MNSRIGPDFGGMTSSLARRLGHETAWLPVPSREFDGFVEIPQDATRSAGLVLSTRRLHGWHRQLFPMGKSGLDPVTTGDWRPPGSDRMRVVVSGAVGRERMHVRAPIASRMPAEMDDFLEWVESPGFRPRVPVLRAITLPGLKADADCQARTGGPGR